MHTADAYAKAMRRGPNQIRSARAKLFDFIRKRNPAYVYFAREGFQNRAKTQYASTFARASTKTDRPRDGGQLISLASSVWPSSGRIDPVVQNLHLHSQDMDSAGWSKFKATVTPDAVSAPDGTMTADLLTEDTTTGSQHRALCSGSVTAGKQYTVSFWAKYNGRAWVQFSLVNSKFSASPTYHFNVLTGAIGSSSGDIVTGSGKLIDTAPGGWMRFMFSTLAAIVSGDTSPGPRLCSGDNVSIYDGDGVSGIYFFGFQIEEGLIAHPYVPTIGAAVSTMADALTVNVGLTTAPNYARTYAMLYEQDYTLASYQANVTLFHHNLDTTGGSVDGVRIYRAGATDWRLLIEDDSATPVSQDFGITTGPGRHVVVASIKSGESWIMIDGVFSATNTGAFVHEGSANTFRVGNSSGSGRESSMRHRFASVHDYAITKNEALVLERLLRAANP